MPFSMEFIEHDGWITAVATGRVDSLEVFSRYSDTILQRLLVSGVRRVLVDNRGLVISIDAYDVTQAARKSVERGVPAFGISYAALCTESMVVAYRIFETVFRNNSLRIRIFSDEAKALEWLTP